MRTRNNPIHADQFLRPRIGKPGVMPYATVQAIDDRIAACADIRRRRTIGKAVAALTATVTDAPPQEFDHGGYRSFWKRWGAEIETMPEGDALRIEEAAKAHFGGRGDLSAWRDILRGMSAQKSARSRAYAPPRSNPYAWGAGLNNGW